MKLTSDDKLIIGLGVLVTALAAGSLWWAVSAATEARQAWAEFTATHVCERTQYTRPGYYITSYVNNVPIMTWVPGEVMFKCDDGNEYWRNQ